MKKKLIALMLCAVMTLSTALTGCGSSSSTSGNEGGSGQTTEAAKAEESSEPVVYKELYSSESSTLNYLVTSTIAEQTVGANCVDTLVEYDSTGQLKEGLATEYSPQERHIYKKNPSNYDAENVFIDEIQQIYNAEAATIGPEMIKRGEIDYAQISADLLDDWLGNEETSNLVSRERPSTSYSYFYCFNFDPQFGEEYEPDNWKKAVNNENFRKALFAGLDKTKEVAVLEPSTPEDYTLTTITPFDFAYNADGTDYTKIGAVANLGDTFNEAKAVEYKEAAMEELSAEGVTFPVKVLMPYNPSVVNWDKECQVVEQQMEALLGTDFIDIIIEAGPTDNFLTEVRRSGKYAFMKCGWGADYADPETWTDPFYQTAGESGYDLGYKYAFLATAITEGTATAPVVQEYFDKVDAAKEITVDTNARYEAFAEAEAVLIDHALVVPFSITVSPYIATKLNVFEAQYAPFGVSKLRFKGQHLQENYVSMEEFEANKK